MKSLQRHYLEIRQKMSSPVYAIARIENEMSDVLARNGEKWMLEHHGEGYPYWGTIGFDGAGHGQMLDLCVFQAAEGVRLFTEVHPKRGRRTKVQTLSAKIDIRHLEPLAEEKARRRLRKILMLEKSNLALLKQLKQKPLKPL